MLDGVPGSGALNFKAKRVENPWLLLSCPPVRMHMCTYTYTHREVSRYRCVYIYISIYMHTHGEVSSYVRICLYTYTHIETYTYKMFRYNYSKLTNTNQLKDLRTARPPGQVL